MGDVLPLDDRQYYPPNGTRTRITTLGTSVEFRNPDYSFGDYRVTSTLLT